MLFLDNSTNQAFNKLCQIIATEIKSKFFKSHKSMGIDIIMFESFAHKKHKTENANLYNYDNQSQVLKLNNFAYNK